MLSDFNTLPWLEGEELRNIFSLIPCCWSTSSIMMWNGVHKMVNVLVN